MQRYGPPCSQRTSKNGQDGLMDGLYFARVQYVAREEGDYEQDDEDGERP